jgi:hypothetical protein
MTSPHNDPLWFRVLERFGLPTLFALLAMGTIFWQIKANREDRREDQKAFLDALQKNTAALDSLRSSVEFAVRVEAGPQLKPWDKNHDAPTRQ